MKQLSNNKCILFFFALFFISGLNAQTSSSYERDWRTDRQKIKIISYNIMDGFSNGSDNDRKDNRCPGRYKSAHLHNQDAGCRLQI